MRAYTEIPELEHFVLEESWVLDISSSPGGLTIRIDLVFDKDHPELKPAPAGDVYYTRQGVLSFDGARRLEWTDQGTHPSRDASGEGDYGHIDSMLWEDDQYELNGDFGTIRLSASRVHIELLGENPTAHR
jgi:hypothetical protein